MTGTIRQLNEQYRQLIKQSLRNLINDITEQIDSIVISCNIEKQPIANDEINELTNEIALISKVVIAVDQQKFDVEQLYHKLRNRYNNVFYQNSKEFCKVRKIELLTTLSIIISLQYGTDEQSNTTEPGRN